MPFFSSHRHQKWRWATKRWSHTLKRYKHTAGKWDGLLCKYVINYLNVYLPIVEFNHRSHKSGPAPSQRETGKHWPSAPTWRNDELNLTLEYLCVWVTNMWLLFFFLPPCEAWRCFIVFVTVAWSFSCTSTARPGFGKPVSGHGHHYSVTVPSKVQNLQSRVGKCITRAFYFNLPVAGVIVVFAVGAGCVCQTGPRLLQILAHCAIEHYSLFHVKLWTWHVRLLSHIPWRSFTCLQVCFEVERSDYSENSIVCVGECYCLLTQHSRRQSNRLHPGVNPHFPL